MMNPLVAWALALITVALVNSVFMLPLLLIMSMIVLIQWGRITKAKNEDGVMWA